MSEKCTTERGSNQGQIKELVCSSFEETLNKLSIPREIAHLDRRD